MKRKSLFSPKNLYTLMNNRKHLHTKFIRFLFERYKDSEVNDIEDFPFINKKSIEPIDIPLEDDEEDIEVQDEDEIIDELLTEYRKLKKQYESKVSKRK